LAVAWTAAASAQSMSVKDYQPRSTLKVPAHPISRAKFPFIDVHAHIWRPLLAKEQDSLVGEMNAMNLAVQVNLSGGSGDTLAGRLANLRAHYPGRFVVFANLSYRGIDESGWGARAAARLEEDVKTRGAAGLKIYKDLGMDLKDGTGKRVAVDDPRLDPVWAAAGRLGIPVLIHTAEPVAFFDPIDERNERWLELTEFPNRARPPERYPPFDSLLAEQHRMFRKFPGTTFIAAHLDWLGNDLDRLGRVLDSLPNVNTELGAVLYELGRQPRRARRFLIDYQDRVLMGKDTYGGPQEYAVYFRVLETEDEYFDYYRRRHAFWKMYGLGLPDDVLRKIYSGNALRLIPGIDHPAADRPAARQPPPA
jgi:predicted TIM-barrel fold metal-dependent hydrolase